jgi:cytochrome c2
MGRLILLALLLAACDARLPDREPTTGGDPKRGRALITHYGCGSCHTIPGVRGATATVGPPLESFKKRVFIAGRIANTPEALVKWIVNPQEVDPKTAMPPVGVDAAQARDIAAYLYAR